MSRVRVSARPSLPPETAQAGGSPGLAEIPGLRCRLRAPSPPVARSVVRKARYPGLITCFPHHRAHPRSGDHDQRARRTSLH